MTKLADCLVDFVGICIRLTQGFKMLAFLFICKYSHKRVIGIKDLSCRLVQVRVAKEHVRNDLQGCFSKYRLHVLDHLLLTVRVGKENPSLIVSVIEVTTIACQ